MWCASGRSHGKTIPRRKREFMYWNNSRTPQMGGQSNGGCRAQGSRSNREVSPAAQREGSRSVQQREDSCGCGTAPETDCGCVPSRQDPIEGMSLAMAYVPWQDYKDVCSEEEGWRAGTIFAQLDLDFMARRCN